MDRPAELLDRLAVMEVITRERLARDIRDWDDMAACYHDDSSVEVSWFKGTGKEFVARTREAVREGAISLHVLQPMTVKIRGERAIAEMPCALRSFSTIDGVDVSIEGFTHLLWRARRSPDGWLVAGLRVIYVRDLMLACNPGQTLQLDQTELAQLRASYRYLAYHLRQAGLSPRDDLPGVDRPDLAAALRDGERKWLDDV